MLEKNNIEKLKEVFFLHPTTEFHVREVSRKTGISPPTVLLAIEILKKHDIVKIYKKGNMKMIKASGSTGFIRAKRINNIKSVYESGIIDYLSDLYDKPKAIILFGSFSRGDDIEKSDIDIAIITNNSKEPKLKEFERKLSRKISIHEIDIKKVSKEFYNNLMNGIIMEGAF